LSLNETTPVSPVSLFMSGAEEVREIKEDAELRQDPGVFLQAQALAERFSSSPAALARLASAALNAGHLNIAQTSAQRALASASKSNDLSSLLAAARILMSFGDVTPVEDALRKHRNSLSYEFAEVLAAQGRHAEALDVTEGDERPANHALRGWLLLKLYRFPEAIHELRTSVRFGESRVDALTNLGYAYGALGSRDKAIRATKEALYLAPADATVAVNLSTFLSLSGDPSTALSILRDVQARNPTDLSLVQAIAETLIQQERIQEALKELRRARDRSDLTTNSPLELAELRGRIVFVEWMLGRRNKANAVGPLENQLRESDYESLDLGYLTTYLLDRPEDISKLEALYQGLATRHDPSDLLFLEAKLAYFKGDFEKLLSASISWAENEPFHVSAQLLASVMIGDIGEGYEAAARFGMAALTRMPAVTMLANNTAYALALAGSPEDARKVLPSETSSPYVRATQALIELVEGNTEAAAAGYREAANLAEKEGDTELASLIRAREKVARLQLGLDRYDQTFVEELATSENHRARLLASVAKRIARGGPPMMTDDPEIVS
jgi:Flp pilus assembly protein TadD